MDTTVLELLGDLPWSEQKLHDALFVDFDAVRRAVDCPGNLSPLDKPKVVQAIYL